MTTTVHAPEANTVIADVEQDTGIQFLSPAPPGCQPEIDYLASLRIFARTRTDAEQVAIEKQILKPLFGISRGGTKALVMTDSVSEYILGGCTTLGGGTEASFANLKTTNAVIYEGIHEIRQMINEVPCDRPCVLLVEEANIPAIQILGAALQLEPSFFLEHEQLDGGGNCVQPGAAALDSGFLEFRRQGDPIDWPNEFVTLPKGARNVHIKGQSYLYYRESIRISCRRIKARACK